MHFLDKHGWQESGILKMPYIVPMDTKVMVADESLTLRFHVTKCHNAFLEEVRTSGHSISFLLDGEDPNMPPVMTPDELQRLGYYTFKTDNEAWPYMVVMRSVFQDQQVIEKLNKINQNIKQIEKLPSLTKKQIKRMMKKSRCPDCDNEYWYGGPCGGGSQNMTCKQCGSKFNVSPLHVERI